MSDTTASLRRKIAGAEELRSVVRTMKAMAASNIGQFEKSVRALADYYRSVELGLSVCLRPAAPPEEPEGATANGAARPLRGEGGSVGVVVFGSDQGLVGRFNDVVADHALELIAALPGTPRVWAVGERVHARLADAGLAPEGTLGVPNSVRGITPLVGQILLESEVAPGGRPLIALHLVHNRPASGAAYEPVRRRLLPLDDAWRREVAARPWPTRNLPEVVGGDAATVSALVREYLFVSLFRACAESLASENASRLAAMQRADRNIDELLEGLRSTFHRLRQSGIDEELFDVIAGFEALGAPRREETAVRAAGDGKG